MLYSVNVPRRRHPRREIEDALRYAETKNWAVVPTKSGHRWGVMRCREATRQGCQVSIWSTPRNTGNHANALRRAVERCPHEEK
jgi:hypothetical protein